MTDLRVDIIIPTHNRAHLVSTAVRAALDQSWWNTRVTVVDDGGSDDTRSVMAPFFTNPAFTYIRLARNVGTAQAMNAGLLLTGGDAVTFHDSDDIPHRDKVLYQVRILSQPAIGAHDCLNWGMVGHEPNTVLQVGVALVHQVLILPDGRRVAIRSDLSLFDDVFPNLQMGSTVPGEWTYINSGLFRAGIFARNGGFAPCIVEDREFRNLLMFNGEIIWIIPELPLTKIETPDSLTQSTETDYDSGRRRSDRTMVWDKVQQWCRQGRVDPVPVDLPGLDIVFISNPAHLCTRDLPATILRCGSFHEQDCLPEVALSQEFYALLGNSRTQFRNGPASPETHSVPCFVPLAPTYPANGMAVDAACSALRNGDASDRLPGRSSYTHRVKTTLAVGGEARQHLLMHPCPAFPEKLREPASLFLARDGTRERVQTRTSANAPVQGRAAPLHNSAAGQPSRTLCTSLPPRTPDAWTVP